MQATAIFVAGLGDQNEWVRLESAKALANLPDVRAADTLRGIAENRLENRDLRIAAADALKHYRTLPTARVLSSVLDDPKFGVSWQARRSLRYLTDRDYGYDKSAWLTYLIAPESQLR
jgi:HEAT repeat protein